MFPFIIWGDGIVTLIHRASCSASIENGNFDITQKQNSIVNMETKCVPTVNSDHSFSPHIVSRKKTDFAK